MELKGKVIDLSQEIYQGMPVYPGHLKTVIWTHLSHEECQRQLGTGFSYETRGIMLCDHGPTHIDSVSHLSRDPKAPSIDQIPLENCITSAICLDVSDIPQKTQFGRKKIEDELKRWKLDIRKGDTILFYTAQYDRYYGKPEYMTDYPGLNREATEFIIDQGCRNFGVDSASRICGTIKPIRVTPFAPSAKSPISKTFVTWIRSLESGLSSLPFH